MQNDINSLKGSTQWFFFSVQNTIKDREVTFNIVNHTKRNSLYTKGVQPIVFSERNYQCYKIGWQRAGRNI